MDVDFICEVFIFIGQLKMFVSIRSNVGLGSIFALFLNVDNN